MLLVVFVTNFQYVVWNGKSWLHLSRFKREEMKIQAWENHQKAKTEAEMRKIEVL